MNPLEKTTDSDDSSVSGCGITAETEDETRVFVAVLTASLLSKFQVVNIWRKDALVAYTKHLVDQTMQGLTVSEGFCPDDKDVKQICKAVIADLKKKYGNMCKLETAIFSEQPAVDAAIVTCLQAHIRERSARSADRKNGRWGKHLWYILDIAAICTVVAFWFVIFL